MPEELDLEEYLAKIKRRWQSSLLSEEQNKKIRDTWDDNWMTDDIQEKERDDAQEQGISSTED